MAERKSSPIDFLWLSVFNAVHDIGDDANDVADRVVHEWSEYNAMLVVKGVEEKFGREFLPVDRDMVVSVLTRALEDNLVARAALKAATAESTQVED